LLSMDFYTWSTQQFNALHGQRAELAKPWLNALDKLNLDQEANEARLADVAALYTDYLHQCKEQGLHWVQPGRFVLPGELVGAPVLQFFP
ncbi:YcjX family protein, partial [Vibrio parahaemolyticus]|uniref:YcjX family protein n=2 Tax=Vibrio TaxID=662 RepID=UPI001A8C436D|nr:YcjX family protein [Vibrio parahaemolyticus]